MQVYVVRVCIHVCTFNMYLGSHTGTHVTVSQPDMGSCKRLLGINVFGGPS